MGRLQALIAGALVALSACDESGAKPAPPPSRSEQVVTTATTTTLASASPAASQHAAVAPTGPRVLCSPVQGRSLAKVSPLRVDAQGGKTEGRIDLKATKLTWLDFWASWCGPCKEEQPRIERFAQQLVKDGVDVQLVHVSMDDDLRQLTTFLAKDTRMKSSLWLPDGSTRETFLATLKMKAAPSLPEHAIVTQDGSAKCFIEGALVDSDYPELVAALKR